MVMKNYPPQFKADAVALYQSRPEATIRQVAADLGINPETLRNWVRAAGASRPRGRRVEVATEPPTPLEAENAALRNKVRELEEEREILRKAAKYFAGGDALVNRFQLVADHQRRYGVKRLCTILGIARSSFYYWCRTAADRAARQAADARLAARIRAVHRESDGTYGVPRITAELREAGERVNHKRIARVMRGAGLAGVRLRRRHRTTVVDPAEAKAPDLIGRDFTADEPNTKYVGDITYLPLDGGKFLYLATVIDLASRRLAGWAIADHMRTDLVTDALSAAERTRGSLAGAIMHTDHGAQYTSRAFADACRQAGVRQSMSAIGSSADNALAESFNATFKRETLQGRKRWSSEREARLDAFRWLNRYNTRRRHSRLGQRSPIAYETALDTTSTTLAQAA
ncbi:IS3 family transposase [Streptomyces caniscabiei]|uniref:IS3 family transposase n=1 Tax=Streptomyces caniscabiei TaxID=2746961 RepID=A0A927L9E4_9ACTN|nr:IS3 family transposase [Streptomyces caniscabiei]MBD9727518.1 IS3 family transposase [Streptomyces caniscabiei]MDX3512591.1 IS3 family transposase [Streptomyces caniscabiei]MDX3722116.1 IS3 family transposase [Streptomyces caniscabiei]MDX3730652.1 IS3 family transposase [Streptomyces caniscabiei]WEO28896.1 IS3 family transposase [Streptomyces caniscabiei]